MPMFEQHEQQTPPPNIEAQAAMELRGMSAAGNHRPRLDTADIAVCRVMARYIQRLERRLKRLEETHGLDG